MECETKSLLSIVIAVEEGTSVNQTLSSIYQNRLQSPIQVILAVCSEKVQTIEDVIEAEYRRSVQLVSVKSTDIADIYTGVKEHIQGKYVSFLTETMYYAEEALRLLEKEMESQKCEAYSIKPVYVDFEEYQKPYPMKPGRSGFFDVLARPDTMQLFFGAYFISVAALEKIPFSKGIRTEKDKDFLLRYFLKYKTYCYVGEAVLYYRDSAENETATNMIQHKKEWYIEDGRKFLLKWAAKTENMKEEKTGLVQYCILYLLFARYNCNFNDRNKKALDEEQTEEFFALSREILKYIPQELILKKKRHYVIPRSIKFLFIRMRCQALGCEYQLTEDGVNFFLEETAREDKIKKISKVSKIKSEKVVITAINYTNQTLEIDLKSNLIDYLDREDIKIKAIYNQKEAQIEEVDCYPLIKVFGKTILRRAQYRVYIPVEEKSMKLEFKLELNGKEYPQGIAFSGRAVRLNRKYKKCYWKFDENRLLVHNGAMRCLYVKTVKNWRIVGREIKLLLDMCRGKKLNRQQNKDRKEMLKTRILYHILKPFYRKKRIWISFDKLYKGGDNGEYMYHYLRENQPDIEAYYIINQDAPDYERLKAEGKHILAANSRRSRLMTLFAETILATHTTVWRYCGFTGGQQEYVRDLLNAEVVCIQHGLTVQKIAQYQNRLFDNTRFYCCASRYEVENILQPIYGYREEEVVLTGLARYDGLKNNDKKQILITPTWRRDVVNNGIACEKKTHNAHFKDTTYFAVYNSLINNKKLIETAKRTGYQIIYLLHPAMSAQSVDFTRNDYVEILEATGDMSYEKILTESSLMVTDYSGVQFDFAYMRKPVVYYHPDLLPPFYEESVFRYETMGFGEICEKEEKLVDLLCEYMENQCKCKEFYIERANAFFAFQDHKSCERIYQAVKQFMAKQQA